MGFGYANGTDLSIGRSFGFRPAQGVAAGVVPPVIKDPATIFGANLLGQWDETTAKFTDATRVTPATTDGQPVGAWDSISGGAAKSLTQATAGNRAALVLNANGTKSAVRFTGTNLVSAQTLANAAMASARPSTVFLVFRVATPTTSMSLCDRQNINNRLAVYIRGDSGPGLQLQMEAGNGTPHGLVSSLAWNIGGGMFGSIPGATCAVLLDGVNYPPEDLGGGTSGTGFLLGGYGGGSLVSPLTGDIIFAALVNVAATEQQLDDMHRYLTSVYGADPGAPGDPTQIGSGLRAWWDASDITTLFQDRAGTIPVTANNQPVGLIKDKSPQAYDIWGGLSPTPECLYAVNLINGKSGLACGGFNSSFQNDKAGGIGVNGVGTVFMVFEPNASDGSNTMFLGTGWYDENIHLVNDFGTMSCCIVTSPTTGRVNCGPYVPGTYQIWIAAVGANGNIFFRKNGVNIPVVPPNGLIRVGDNGRLATMAGMFGHACEQGVYDNVLTPEQILELERYLSLKYGIPIP